MTFQIHSVAISELLSDVYDKDCFKNSETKQHEFVSESAKFVAEK